MAKSIVGNVVGMTVAKGSKSEHGGVVLVTKDRKYVLKRRGGNPFRDPELEALVGKRIRCRGELLGATLLLDDWTEVKPSAE